MRYSVVIINGNKITDNGLIDEKLNKLGFDFIVDAEVSKLDFEIKNNTFVMNNGHWISGDMEYGILKGGIFSGKMVNGIIDGVEFSGEFISGIKNT